MCLKEIGTIICNQLPERKNTIHFDNIRCIGFKKKHRELTADVKRYSQLSNTLKLINHY